MPDTTTTAVVPDVKGGCNTHCPHGGECSLEPGHETDHQALIAGGRVRCTWPRHLPAATSGCETVDLIVHWGEVQEGDLVLHDGEMRIVEERMAHTLRPDIKVAFRLSGLGIWQTCEIAKRTAVTRYVTTTDEG
jgi:hypothetical protein